MKRQTFSLPAGTVCTRDGIPFALANDTLIECCPENFERIKSRLGLLITDEEKVTAQMRWEMVRPRLKGAGAASSSEPEPPVPSAPATQSLALDLSSQDGLRSRSFCPLLVVACSGFALGLLFAQVVPL